MKEHRNIPDEKLIELIRSENKEWYGFIVERYEKKLLSYARYLIRDEDAAVDAVQNAFIKAYVNLNGFDTNKKFSSWIYRIVHNEAMSAVSKNPKEVRLREDALQDSGLDTEEDFTKKEISRAANACLSQIPLMYSEPLILHYLEDKSYGEISDILRIPLGTVSIRMRRAKIYMKRICEKNRSI